MSIKTNELQQITAPQSSDSLLLDTAAAGTGRLTLAQAAQFFDQKLLQPGTQISASLSQKANAGSPERFNIPIPDGLDGNIYYFKTQENIVFLNGYLQNQEGTIANRTQIGTMPEGYRARYSPGGIGFARDATGTIIGVVNIAYNRNTHIISISNVPDGTNGINITAMCYLSL